MVRRRHGLPKGLHSLSNHKKALAELAVRVGRNVSLGQKNRSDAVIARILTQKYKLRVSTTTVWRYRNRLMRPVAYGKRTYLSEPVREARYKLALDLLRCPRSFFRLASGDEKKWVVSRGSSNNAYVLSRDDPMRSAVTHGRLETTLMTFGLVTADGEGFISMVPSASDGSVTSEYFADFLEQRVIPFMRERPHLLLEIDNASAHSSDRIRGLLREVNVYPWPARAADMAPIEAIWARAQGIVNSYLAVMPPERMITEAEFLRLITGAFYSVIQDKNAIQAVWMRCWNNVVACKDALGGNELAH